MIARKMRAKLNPIKHVHHSTFKKSYISKSESESENGSENGSGSGSYSAHYPSVGHSNQNYWGERG